MDIDPLESVAATDGASGPSGSRQPSRLNAAVAVVVALLATFMGVCKVKDDNIVQAMQQAQADKKEELRRQALADQQAYDALNFRDDQFDLSDALIALLG